MCQDTFSLTVLEEREKTKKKNEMLSGEGVGGGGGKRGRCTESSIPIGLMSFQGL